MGGVDLVDANVASCRISLRGKKWYFPIFLYLLDLCCVNAWHHYRLCSNKSKDLNSFKTDVALSLLARCTKQKNQAISKTEARFTNVEHVIEYTDQELRCKICSKNSKFKCPKCNVNLHPKLCYKLYHTK